MKPELVVIDWLYGYETPEEMQGVPLAFSTPHDMMQVPRKSELINTKISYITRSKDFSSMEEINAFLGPIMMNPYKLEQALYEANPSEEERDYLDYLDILDQAHQANQKEAKRLIFKSLLYSRNPIDAYLWIANHLCKTKADTEHILSLAVHRAENALDDSLKNEIGNFWFTQKTRAFLRAKATYGEYTFFNATSPEQTNTGISLLESILQFDKDDHMEIRFLLMSIYSEESRFDKMTTLFKQFPKDSQNPLFLYPMAFMYYMTLGPDHGTTTSFIHQAIWRNPHVINIILNYEEIPFFEGPSFTKQSREEAIYFLNISFDYIEPDEALIHWLQSAYDEFLTKMPINREGTA